VRGKPDVLRLISRGMRRAPVALRLFVAGARCMPATLLLLLTGLSCSSAPEAANVVGGTFVGYTYSEQAVVDQAIETEGGYTLTFRAYDLGGEARFVAYAQREISGAYYLGIIRLGIEDPAGNVFTHYHNADAEAIDRPIMWNRRVPGVHRVTVEFVVRGDQISESTFEAPLVREPVSGLLVLGVSLGVLFVAALAVILVRRRK